MYKKYIFVIFAGLVAFALTTFIVHISRKKIKYSKSIRIVMLFALMEIPIYCVTVFSQNYKYSYIAFTLSLIIVEWLTFYFLCFVVEYSLTVRKTENLFRVLFSVTLIESLVVFTNIFFGYLFDITLVRSPLDSRLFGWNITYKPYIFIHYLFPYSYIISSIVILIRAADRSASCYKMRFIGVLAAYVVVILSHIVCLFVHQVTDYSILLYGLLGAFISYYITYTAPNQLIYQILKFYTDSAEDALLYFDDKGKLLFANTEAKRIFSRDGSFSQEAAEEYCSNVILRYVKIKHEMAKFTDSIIVGGDIFDFKGEYREFVDKKNLIGAFLHLENITQENVRYKKQQYIANNDPLTGIYNREYFFAQVDETIKKDPYTPRLMIASNIVDFKLINEVLGTDFSDAILIKTAELIHNLSKADDLYCRIGDDKFAVFMRKSLFDAEIFEESFRVIQKITESESFKIKIETGIYEVQGDRETARVMYDKAFLAMSNKNTSSKQLFHYYDAAFMEKIFEEKNMISAFDENLHNHKFDVYFSPIKNPEKKLIAIEADSKLFHSQKGLIDSKDYLPVLEKYGVAYKLDRFVWSEAINYVSVLNREYDPELKLLLQVSAKDTYYLDIYETLVELVNKYDCNPANVSVEFLEEAISYDFREMNETFKKMQNYGFNILFNKFGSGQSSLNLLKETNLNGVKIDSKFVEEVDFDDKTHKILAFMISLANTLGLNAYVSGVDSRHQFEFLQKLNIQGYQGLYCGEEMNFEQFCNVFCK